MSNKTITKPRAISGFPEWLPEQQALQDRFVQKTQEVFESFGFAHLETAAVELTEVLAAKGVEQKEIYSLTRLQSDDKKDDARYSLHFDLTVPFARYVALHQGELVFPFKRYQIQKVWRGERPAQGRFREFYQCDIDIVGIDQLPLGYDAEMLEVMGELFRQLDIGHVCFKVNHRRLLDGFYDAVGVDQELRPQVLVEVDKLEKVGPEVVGERLEALGVNTQSVEKILAFAQSTHGGHGLRDHLLSLAEGSETYLQGVEELCEILSEVPQCEGIDVIWDGSITRGLNYYTGTIFETALRGAEELGSICSGGRYEDLCGRFSKTKMPGVGISLGLTRLLSHLLAQQGATSTLNSSPTEIMFICMKGERRLEDLRLARELRRHGWKVEVTPVGKLKKWMNLANRRGASVVVIPNEDGSFAWKNMGSGNQENLSEADLLNKTPS